MTLSPLSVGQKSTVLRAVTRYQEALHETPEAWDYLVSQRGLSEATIRDAALGFVARGGAEPGHEGAQGYISIPYLATSGPVAVRFRALDPNKTPKYWQPAGSRTRLYNVASLANSSSDVVYICEGEMDTLVAKQIGLGPVVGIPGVSNWKPHFKPLFDGFQTVIVLADADDKGQGAQMATELAQLLPAHDVRPLLMPEGHDLNSAYLEGGKEMVLSWIHGTYDDEYGDEGDT